MSRAMIHFLLVYSHAEQRLLEQYEFKNSTHATRAYGEAERNHQGREDLEIVLIGSDSIETIMKTHGHYFDSETDRFPFEFELLPA